MIDLTVPFVVLVCGGRTYNDAERVSIELDALHRDRVISMVVQGGAHGADSLAKRWARSRLVHCAQVDALWDQYGKSAGSRRNVAMLYLRPSLVLAFPGGPGTAHMVGAARTFGFEVREVSS